jgi:hypothetical protein
MVSKGVFAARLDVRVLGTVVLVAIASWLSVRWLSTTGASLVLFGLTVLAVCVAASVLWLERPRNGWAYLAAFLLAVSPLALHEAAEDLAFGEGGELDECTITGVETQLDAGDALPGAHFLHRLDCLQAGARQLRLGVQLGAPGERTQVRYGANDRQDPVPAFGVTGSGADLELAAAGVLLLATAGSTVLAYRRAAVGGRSTEPAHDLPRPAADHS